MMDCKNCKENRQKLEPVPFIVHESAMARAERTIKRLWILALVALALLVGTNGAWLWYESQFEIVETTEKKHAKPAENPATASAICVTEAEESRSNNDYY